MIEDVSGAPIVWQRSRSPGALDRLVDAGVGSRNGGLIDQGREELRRQVFDSRGEMALE